MPSSNAPLTFSVDTSTLPQGFHPAKPYERLAPWFDPAKPYDLLTPGHGPSASAAPGTWQVDTSSLPPGFKLDDAPPASETSLGSEFRAGVHDVTSGVGSTMDVLGAALARHGLPEWGTALFGAGKSVASSVDAPGPAYSDAGKSVVDALRDGRYGDAIGLLPRAAVRAVPALVGTLGAGAAAAALAPEGAAAALAGGLGAGAFNAAQVLGPTAQARAANNGEAAPSDSD